MLIRRGVEEDISACVEMARDFHEVAYGLHGIPFCEESTDVSFAMCLDHGLLVVAEHEGEIVGMAAGVKSPMTMNHNYIVGAELCWWVKPEHRKGNTGIKLVIRLEELAKDLGVKVWSMLLLESSEPEKVAKIYDKMGYIPSERTYIKVF